MILGAFSHELWPKHLGDARNKLRSDYLGKVNVARSP